MSCGCFDRLGSLGMPEWVCLCCLRLRVLICMQSFLVSCDEISERLLGMIATGKCPRRTFYQNDSRRTGRRTASLAYLCWRQQNSSKRVVTCSRAGERGGAGFLDTLFIASATPSHPRSS